MPQNNYLKAFEQYVSLKYRIYDGMFLTLPFKGVKRSGSLLPLFNEVCHQGYAQELSPDDIIERFFQQYLPHYPTKQRIDLLFKFIQYIEREVVLFDAIEDAAFTKTHPVKGPGTLVNLTEKLLDKHQIEALQDYFKDFKVRPVLTAHPTQFYPGSVLAIITDLIKSLQKDDLFDVNTLLAQLGKTSLFKRKKPTPYEEALGIIWYLENVFYTVSADIYTYIVNNIYDGKAVENEVIDIGFWPGGDRDGNPFVTPEITWQVAVKLKQSIARNYYKDLKALRRRLTFKGIEEQIKKLEHLMYQTAVDSDAKSYVPLTDFKQTLWQIRAILIQENESLFLDLLDRFIHKVHLFGYHFAIMDIRQDSRIHHQAFEAIIPLLQAKKSLPDDYLLLSEDEQLPLLSQLNDVINVNDLKDENAGDIYQTLAVAHKIQQNNGPKSVHRYIISNTQSAVNVMEVYAFLKTSVFHQDMSMDIVPLFETIPDLEKATDIMQKLYELPAYRQHLHKRGNKQTIMLGFSDGTKDGGYLMANWSIYKAKERLTQLAEKYGITVIFFDGRGGPPARGGGKTHKFYASLGPHISDKEVQLTIQGQTISSNYGTAPAAKYNLEQLVTSVFYNRHKQQKVLQPADRVVLDDLAQISYEAYQAFKKHPLFVPYLTQISPLKYFSKMNVGSRPSKRGQSTELKFEDLRAIPFVASWSMLKQNVPGFYGLGTALKVYEDRGEFYKVKQVYADSAFFQTLVENSMMSLAKSFFNLTKYMAKDPVFGPFWEMIYQEYQLAKRLLLKLTGYDRLMGTDLIREKSIEMREQIVLPLLTIQQFALHQIRRLSQKEIVNDEDIRVYEKLIIRSLLGNINASRNSA